MKIPFFTSFILGVILIFLAVSNSLFTLHQTKKALVLQFGELVKVHDTPGLKVKIPVIQDVIFFDRRLLDYNLPVIEVNAGDQKRMVVDLYVRYIINDVLVFYKTVGTLEGVQNRLGKIVPDIMQEVIGRVPLSEMLSSNRAKIMEEIFRKVRDSSKNFGIDVRDVRIIRADLPKENSEAIFNRMESERRQEAKQFRAEGDEQAQGIRAKADRERTLILAQARKKSEILRGEGEAEAARIYANAFSQDTDFFKFYRSMDAYQKVMTPEDTTLVISPSSEFFRYFHKNKLGRN
ncbi:MAG: protease modulator HflC [Candidatus Paracaedimonas acanthamoebae]|uniref:Protein HflC n=1 Tax=Candidatus Paracaedimonas acanthamoebae TaxID=244581 RepID=A0A8J7PID3_9PROT|nr:protease modulator HflC [Candidatus Paracaedimonas acanthamoebae]